MRFLYLFSILLVASSIPVVHSTSCSRAKRPRLITINPQTLFDPTPLGYSHISLDTLNAVANVAGQVAINTDGQIVGTTLAEQLVETERSLKFILKALDADVEDITKMNVYIRNFDTAIDLAVYQPTGFRMGSPATTLVSTPSLALDGLLVEIEMSVAVSRKFVRKVACKRPRRG